MKKCKIIKCNNEEEEYLDGYCRKCYNLKNSDYWRNECYRKEEEKE